MGLQAGSYFLLDKAFTEHHMYPDGELLEEDILPNIPPPILFKQRADCVCLSVNVGRRLTTSYYVGTDWIWPGKAVYVQPKLDNTARRTDYLRMLLACMGLRETGLDINNLFEIKFAQPAIQLTPEQDLLTPLLIIRFLSLVKEIVRKGLKASYYRVEHNLYGKIKGKVLVAKTIKQNVLKHKQQQSYCSYDEFGYNGLENRLIKKTLSFVRNYLAAARQNQLDGFAEEVFNYVTPAFELVSDEVDMEQVKQVKFNGFYKEYGEAIHLAKMILKRFGYNIIHAQQRETISTPPFWINMSLLFELYVLGLLRERFKNPGDIKYHFTASGSEIDYLLRNSEYKMVIDAKYKPRYKYTSVHEDVRQVSGYARLGLVYETLGMDTNTIIDCLIIYPDQGNGLVHLRDCNLTENSIPGYVRVYKLPVQIPVIQPPGL